MPSTCAGSVRSVRLSLFASRRRQRDFVTSFQAAIISAMSAFKGGSSRQKARRCAAVLAMPDHTVVTI